MSTPSSKFLSILSILLLSISLATSDGTLDNFLQCLNNQHQPSNPISTAIYTPTNFSFQSTLVAYIKNRRFLTPNTPKPLAIVAATHESHIQATIICAKAHGLQIRIRSGGHDYEGLSYTSNVPFVILDMFNLRSIDIDLANETAWVQSGATTGELYYQIAKKSNVLAFPAAVGIIVGVGGHFSGAGYGNLIRKYGLTVDNIIDAQIVDVNGRILNRKSMGEDLFWAIRGGGGASFGVILSWKIKLVPVPAKVTVFRVTKTLEQGATDVVYQWQQVASKLNEDLFIRAMPRVVNGSSNGEKTVAVAFIGLFLGQTDRLLPLVSKSFPKLGLQQKDCIEMSWVNSTLFWDNFPLGTSIEQLLNRPPQPENFFKGKSDYVKNPIPKEGLDSIWKMMIKFEISWMQWNPYGGIMSNISESATPFPHRAGNLFKIQYYTSWFDEKGNATNKNINGLRGFYDTMTPYVSEGPRESYLNYRDLDIGSTSSNQTNCNVAKVYGMKYFKGNYQRLTDVKAKVDPDNFFLHEQSIPPSAHYKLN